MTDIELRALIRSSPEQGYRALYETYANYVYAVIARILVNSGTQEDVEDCLVETFTEVIQQIDSIKGDSIKAYLSAAARNRALNYCSLLRRAQLNTVPLDTVQEPGMEHVQEQLEQKALQRRLIEEIKALGEPDATILVQKYYYGKKMKEIARMVGLSPNTAQVRCSRALNRLRTKLADWR